MFGIAQSQRGGIHKTAARFPLDGNCAIITLISSVIRPQARCVHIGLGIEPGCHRRISAGSLTPGYRPYHPRTYIPSRGWTRGSPHRRGRLCHAFHGINGTECPGSAQAQAA